MAAPPTDRFLLRGPTNKTKANGPAMQLELPADALAVILRNAKAGRPAFIEFGREASLKTANKTYALTSTPETAIHELYRPALGAQTASIASLRPNDLVFAGTVGHRLALAERKNDNAGMDAAVAQLKTSLASIQQEKEANRTTILTSAPGLARPRPDLKKKKNSASFFSALVPTKPVLHPGPTNGLPNTSLLNHSSPLRPTDTSATDLLQAIRTPLLHLLALGPAAVEELVKKVRCREEQCLAVLRKIGRPSDATSKIWGLHDKAYKELDVWNFKYPCHDDRQKAIDSAIHAFDRLRLGPEEIIWQQLLPRQKRNTGIVLSKLQLNILGGHVPRPVLNPLLKPRPAATSAGKRQTSVTSTTEKADEASGGGGASSSSSSGAEKVTKKVRTKVVTKEEGASRKAGEEGTATPPTKSVQTQAASKKTVAASQARKASAKVEAGAGTMSSKSESSTTSQRSRAKDGAGAAAGAASSAGSIAARGTARHGTHSSSSSSSNGSNNIINRSKPKVPSPLGQRDLSYEPASSPLPPGGPTGGTKRKAAAAGEQDAARKQQKTGQPPLSSSPRSTSKTTAAPERGRGTAGTAGTGPASAPPAGQQLKRKESPTEQAGERAGRAKLQKVGNGGADSTTKKAPATISTSRAGSADSTTHSSAETAPALSSASSAASAASPPTPFPSGGGDGETLHMHAGMVKVAGDEAEAEVESEGLTMSFEQRVEQARKFQYQYTAYAELHGRLSNAAEAPSAADRASLLAMHEKLSVMKQEIRTGISMGR